MLSHTMDQPAESELRFLDYRLDIVRRWAPSERKRVTVEAISRRIATLVNARLEGPEVQDLMAISCQMLDDVFRDEGRPVPETAPRLLT